MEARQAAQALAKIIRVVNTLHASIPWPSDGQECMPHKTCQNIQCEKHTDSICFVMFFSMQVYLHTNVHKLLYIFTCNIIQKQLLFKRPMVKC